MKRATIFFTILMLSLAAAACGVDSDTEKDAADSDQKGTADVQDPPAPHSVLPSDAADDDDNDNDNNDDASPGACESIPPSPWPEPDFEDPVEVSFDEQLFFTIDGQRFFPIGFYSAPEDDEGLAQYKSEGFNIALTGPGCCGGGTQPQIDFLRRAQEHGLFIIMHPWSDPNDVLNRPEDELAAELAERNGVGNLFGWYTFDEPALWRPPQELTNRMHEVLSTYSPMHPDMLVEQAMDDFNLYEDDCSVFMIDPYPVPHLFISMVKASMKEAREATEYAKPIIGVMQAFSWDWIYDNYDVPFRPTAIEVRNMAWQFIVLGARGLLPWPYSGDYSMRAVPEIWASYLATVAELNELMRVLVADDVPLDLPVESTFPNSFDYLVKRDATATWILTVSTNEHGLPVTLDLSALGENLCVVDYTTGELFSQGADGKVNLMYGGLQVRILEVRNL